jgi:hypothetical protein
MGHYTVYKVKILDCNDVTKYEQLRDDICELTGYSFNVKKDDCDNYYVTSEDLNCGLGCKLDSYDFENCMDIIKYRKNFVGLNIHANCVYEKVSIFDMYFYGNPEYADDDVSNYTLLKNDYF